MGYTGYGVPDHANVVRWGCVTDDEETRLKSQLSVTYYQPSHCVAHNVADYVTCDSIGPQEHCRPLYCYIIVMWVPRSNHCPAHYQHETVCYYQTTHSHKLAETQLNNTDQLIRTSSMVADTVTYDYALSTLTSPNNCLTCLSCRAGPAAWCRSHTLLATGPAYALVINFNITQYTTIIRFEWVILNRI